MPVSPIARPSASAQKCVACTARATSVCNAVPRMDLALLARIAERRVVPPMTGFIQEGDAANAFFTISHGTARLYKMLPDGRRQVTGFAGAGHFLGFATANRYAFSAEAVDRVTYCRYPRTRWMALVAEYPQVGAHLLEFAANELIAAQEQMLLLGRKSAHERLASFMLAPGWTVAEGRMDGRGTERLALPMSRSDIADYLGLSPEAVSRTITRLRVEGVIELVGNSAVLIRDRQALRAIADGTRRTPLRAGWRPPAVMSLPAPPQPSLARRHHASAAPA